ncbi:MAG: bifunctional phosphopantothenoylcysteine decarboxylase/phosphopantothenate--cysteine ligase CoaBC [Actinomycetota bacterium]|nr:bifunctional phosphopantothenoylcysteine decarboxylase/phosphopantothenate--cysteine ligase CoaBC [Actinomycetota bacterium]
MAEGARRKTVLVGVTGSIAAYKACELVRLLVKDGRVVVPLLTPDAERFVSVHTLEALARRESPRELYPHLVEADLLVVAPLSANTLAKLAHGFADTVLAQAALAFRGPVLVAPAMNGRMWEHAATQANALLLRERGVEILGPETGELAEGEVAAGRMTEPEAIAARCRTLLEPADAPLAGKRVLVSAGGTREPLDAVRYVANRSSGKMGVALAAEAARRGAEVTLLYANGSVPPPAGIEVVETPTAAELAREALARGREADVVLMAAAVADYRPREPITGKRGKDAEAWTVTLEPTEDVLARLGAERRDGQVIVGFAADVGPQGLARAREKLRRKRGTLIVFNDVSRADIGFAADENEVVLLSERGERTIGKRSKDEVAAAILDEVATHLGES